MAEGDIDIARRTKLKHIDEVAARLGVAREQLLHYGPYKAKLAPECVRQLAPRPSSKLILVTAITPTPAGEGKTTTTVGLGDALNRIGKQAVICLREPSLGPCFGIKGGAAGGGHSQVVPMEDINLHFTGDFHAITTTNNLLAALIDNHVYWGNKLDLDVRRISWRRVLDMNDRALRSIVSSLGGAGNGFPREDGFDITVASEVMAIFCLATDLDDLGKRLANIIVGQDRSRQPVRASSLDADGAMTVLLRDAFMPNLVQTTRRQPCVRPRRAVCEHRARLQLGDRDHDGAAARRLRGDRGRASVPTWAPRSSSTSSAARPASRPPRRSLSRRCAPSRCTVAWRSQISAGRTSRRCARASRTWRVT